MTLPLWPQQDLGPVRRGDIFALGRHRLACIDATDKAAVARLFDGRKPTLVVTSPPYADARDYNDPIPCWDSMMLGALDGHPFADDVQMLVNLGSINRKNEWQPYWFPWMQAMRAHGWRHAGLYVWDKLSAHPGNHNCRLLPAHEFIVHLNKKNVPPNKTHSCKSEGRLGVQYGLKGKNNKQRTERVPLPCQKLKVMDSVLRLHPEKANKTAHPAVYPVTLPSQLIGAYKQNTCVTYDPFAGSGTTLLAGETEQVDALAAEISPSYVQIAIDRWRKLHPDKPVRRITAPAPD